MPNGKNVVVDAAVLYGMSPALPFAMFVATAAVPIEMVAGSVHCGAVPDEVMMYPADPMVRRLKVSPEA